MEIPFAVMILKLIFRLMMPIFFYHNAVNCSAWGPIKVGLPLNPLLLHRWLAQEFLRSFCEDSEFISVRRRLLRIRAGLTDDDRRLVLAPVVLTIHWIPQNQFYFHIWSPKNLKPFLMCHCQGAQIPLHHHRKWQLFGTGSVFLKHHMRHHSHLMHGAS